jgi:hypothetical protein
MTRFCTLLISPSAASFRSKSCSYLYSIMGIAYLNNVLSQQERCSNNRIPVWPCLAARSRDVKNQNLDEVFILSLAIIKFCIFHTTENVQIGKDTNYDTSFLSECGMIRSESARLSVRSRMYFSSDVNHSSCNVFRPSHPGTSNVLRRNRPFRVASIMIHDTRRDSL